MKPILILDAGGVIIDDLSTQFWDKLIAKSKDINLNREVLYKHYKSELSEHLWAGRIDEDEILIFLSLYQIHLSKDELREAVGTCLVPLPAFDKVKDWASKVNVYIMSNHRTNWLLPALEPIRLFLTDIYVSDSFQVKKPNLEWFKLITEKHAQQDIMFVDNTMHNIDAAKQSGWQTIYADDTYKWIDEVETWLSKL